MEGHRLILKRKSKRSSHRLLFAFGAGVALCFTAMFLQLKTTLSKQSIAALSKDITNTAAQLPSGGTQGTATPSLSPTAQKNLDDIQSLLEASIQKAFSDSPEPAVAGESTTAVTESLVLPEPNPSLPQAEDHVSQTP